MNINTLQNYRLHAFVPIAQADEMEKKLKLGKNYKIYNFIVKNYKHDEKFRCIHSEKQIMLTNHTKVAEVIESDDLIPNNIFDFYDLDDLKPIANQNTYLTGKVLHTIKKTYNVLTSSYTENVNIYAYIRCYWSHGRKNNLQKN